jgi:hypothetical protein
VLLGCEDVDIRLTSDRGRDRDRDRDRGRDRGRGRDKDRDHPRGLVKTARPLSS